MFLSEVHGLVVVPQGGVGVPQTPARTAFTNPAAHTHTHTHTEVLGFDEVFVYGSLVVLQQGVCVCVCTCRSGPGL